MYKELTSERLFPGGFGLAEALLTKFEYPWDALPHIKDFIIALGESLPTSEYERRDENVWVARSATIAPTAFLGANIIIGPGTEVRHGAYLRGNVLIDRECVAGNSSEFKNSILLPHAKAPHYNYIGDSVLGNGAHFGAGSITSNIKADTRSVTIMMEGKKLDTGLRKFGAMVGDSVEIGCNAVLNPGSVIGAHSRIYPLTFVRGYVPPKSIKKNSGEVVPIVYAD